MLKMKKSSVSTSKLKLLLDHSPYGNLSLLAPAGLSYSRALMEHHQRNKKYYTF